MRPTVRVVAAGIAGSCLAACAALTGLDQITENACAPDGCADAAGAGDAKSQEGMARDGSTPMPDASEASASLEASADPSADADAAADADPDADADARADASADSSPDSPCGTIYLSESFASADAGWTLDSTWSIAPTCSSPPSPQKGNPDPTVDHTTGSAGGVAGVYVCGNNPSGTTAPSRYATSPAVDVSAAPAVKLGFYRWLNTDADGWMTSTVDVYDGTAWVNVYTNPSGAGNIVADGAWTKFEYDVTVYKNAAFRVRFGYAVTDSGVYSMSCWNVDDVTVSSASCP
jgi:hypothetical protein